MSKGTQVQGGNLIVDAIEYVSKTSDFGSDQGCTILDTIGLNLELNLPTTTIDLKEIWPLKKWMRYGNFQESFISNLLLNCSVIYFLVLDFNEDLPRGKKGLLNVSKNILQSKLSLKSCDFNE